MKIKFFLFIFCIINIFSRTNERIEIIVFEPYCKDCLNNLAEAVDGLHSKINWNKKDTSNNFEKVRIRNAFKKINRNLKIDFFLTSSLEKSPFLILINENDTTTIEYEDVFLENSTKVSPSILKLIRNKNG